MFKRHLQKIILFFMVILCITTSSVVAASQTLSIEINGVTGGALKNVRDQLNLLKESYGETRSHDAFYQAAPEQIRQALEPFGFFKAKIAIKQSAHTFIVTIHPGDPVKITRLSVTLSGAGKENSELQKYLHTFPLAVGQPLHIKKYEAAKEKLFVIANNQGYMRAVLTKKEIRIDLKKDSAEITLEFDTGPQFYFGHVIFAPGRYSQAFLQRFSQFKANEPFSSQRLTTFQQDLSNSRYFQQVDVTPDLNIQEGNHTIPVNVAVTAPKSQRYNAGIGYGTSTGPRLTLGADFRRMTDTGQRLNIELKLSSVLSAFTTKYYIPGKNPLTDQYTVGANIQYFYPKNGSSFSQSLTGSYIKNLKEWQNTVSLNLLNEKYKVEKKPTHFSQVLYPNWTASRVKADNLIYPRFGNLINFTVQGASTSVASKSTFFQSEVKGKTIFSPTKNSRVILRGDLGYTVVENLNQLPLTLRYFAGGLGSVRGYPYSSIGPGKYLEVASAEVQHKIYGKLNGAVFYDIGNASDTFNGKFKRGAGVGVIYRSFIGPIQLYVGQALSKKNRPYSVEFSIGPDF